MAGKRPKWKELELHWLSIAKRWQASGLSQAAFCQQEGLVATTFYSWRSTLEKRKLLPVIAQVPKTATAVKGTGSETCKSFVPLEVKPADLAKVCNETAGRLEIVTPGGYIVRIP